MCTVLLYLISYFHAMQYLVTMRSLTLLIWVRGARRIDSIRTMTARVIVLYVTAGSARLRHKYNAWTYACRIEFMPEDGSLSRSPLELGH